MSHGRTIAFVALASALYAGAAAAQPVGSFRWQLQPYCNVMTVNVTQQGAIYTLDGTDDRCGGGSQPGSAVGVAYLTPQGLVGFGISTVLPNGTPVHTEATISHTSLSGTWRDSAGNGGAFTFTPGAPVPGAPRAIPAGGIAPASITNVHLSNNAVTGANVVDSSITSADIVDGTRIEFAGSTDVVFLPFEGNAPANLRSVTINAPRAGKVIVNASGFFEFDSSAWEDGRCEITTSATAINNNFAFYGAEPTTATSTMLYVPFGSTRGFNVAAGANTFNLLCDKIHGNVRVWRAHMTAIYSAQ